MTAESEARVDAVLARLLGLHPKLIDLSLERMQRLLTALGDPQHAMPNIIHVAGTNGKGSTVAFMRACLEAAGKRVNVFSKPHLIRFNERIRLAGALIDDEALIALLEECERVNDGQSITYFEITTAAAFLAFARQRADVTLIETGLGGRFDASNVFRAPIATAITPVSLDHQHFLGDTVGQIAFEKAGIFKPGVPAVLAPQSEEAEKVLVTRANETGAPLFRFGQEWRVWPSHAGLHYESRRWKLDLPQPGLLGRHQYDNAGTALACLDRAGFVIGPGTLAEGLSQVQWPARLEHLTEGTLVAAMPPGWELWLDGGHNQAGGAALGAMAQTWRDKPLRLIFGMLESHDAVAFLKSLAPHVAGAVTVAVPGEPATRSADNAAAAARAAGIAAEPAPDIRTAVGRAATGTPGRVLICGSLYLAGGVLAENRPNAG
ncbi:MAG TPA: folylpolyglutamate synthase/dihydrofolate synthase family protein [Stellaceae bacterium]